jgi:RHS repeat-associated protein
VAKHSTDVKGNITRSSLNLTPQSSPLALQWDFDNKLRSADLGNNNSVDVNFQYDALGRRVARTGTGGSVVYVQHDQQTIADYPVGGVATTPTNRYVYASYIDEPVVRKAAGTGGTIHYYHRNQQYSITAMTTSSGAVAERYAYTAYGQPTILNASGTVLTSSAFGNRYTYTGREWDETLGLHHFRARWMSPLAGRFLGRDPIGYWDGLSLYRSYIEGSNLDPLGYAILDAEPTDPSSAKWCNRPLPRDVLGRTIPDAYSVKCYCVCCDSNYCNPKRKIHCRVNVRLDISISEANIGNAPRKWTKENVYGHEQLHIKNLLENAREVLGLLTNAENTIGCISVESCPDRAKTMENVANGWMKKYLKEEAKHKRPHPKDNEPYDPINGKMPAEDCSGTSRITPFKVEDCKDGF